MRDKWLHHKGVDGSNAAIHVHHLQSIQGILNLIVEGSAPARYLACTIIIL